MNFSLPQSVHALFLAFSTTFFLQSASQVFPGTLVSFRLPHCNGCNVAVVANRSHDARKALDRLMQARQFKQYVGCSRVVLYVQNGETELKKKRKMERPEINPCISRWQVLTEL